MIRCNRGCFPVFLQLTAKKGCKVRESWHVQFPSFGCLTGADVPFAVKKGCFLAHNDWIQETTCQLAATPWVALLRLGLNLWIREGQTSRGEDKAISKTEIGIFVDVHTGAAMWLKM